MSSKIGLQLIGHQRSMLVTYNPSLRQGLVDDFGLGQSLGF